MHKDILFPAASGNITAVYSKEGFLMEQTAENILPGIKTEKKNVEITKRMIMEHISQGLLKVNKNLYTVQL